MLLSRTREVINFQLLPYPSHSVASAGATYEDYLVFWLWNVWAVFDSGLLIGQP